MLAAGQTIRRCFRQDKLYARCLQQDKTLFTARQNAWLQQNKTLKYNLCHSVGNLTKWFDEVNLALHCWDAYSRTNWVLDAYSSTKPKTQRLSFRRNLALHCVDAYSKTNCTQDAYSSTKPKTQRLSFRRKPNEVVRRSQSSIALCRCLQQDKNTAFVIL